jgi:hypothetical protein
MSDSLRFSGGWPGRWETIYDVIVGNGVRRKNQSGERICGGECRIFEGSIRRAGPGWRLAARRLSFLLVLEAGKQGFQFRQFVG